MFSVGALDFQKLISELYDISEGELIRRINRLGLNSQVTPVFATYNRAEPLKWAVRNVLDNYVVRETGVVKQAIKQAIIVDDRSNDPMVSDTLEELERTYGSMIRIIRVPEKIYCFNAWDMGIFAAEGSKYVLIGDDDSLLH